MLSDGYDLQAAALAGPGLVQSWHVDRAALGPVFSASLFGMLFGGPLFAYIGDRFGRKTAIISGGVLYGVVTLVAAGASSLNELMLLRFITGLGLGGLPPNCIALNAEFAPKRVRATMIVVMYLGVTVGSMLPAAVTAAMGQTYRWQTLFIIGAIMPLAAAVILFFGLPESIKFLVLHKKSREQIARLVASIQPGLSLAPDAEFVISEGSGKPSKLMVTALFSGGLAWITSLVWLLYVVNLMANFFLHNWMPILFRDDGLTIRQMGIATAMYDVGGIFGALVASRLLDKWGIKTLVAFFALGIPACRRYRHARNDGVRVGSIRLHDRILRRRHSACPECDRRDHLSHGHPGQRRRLGELNRPIRRHSRPVNRRLAHCHACFGTAIIPGTGAPDGRRRDRGVCAHALLRRALSRRSYGRSGGASSSFDIPSQLSAPAFRKQDSWPTSTPSPSPPSGIPFRPWCGKCATWSLAPPRAI